MIIEIDNISDERLKVYGNLSDRRLRSAAESQEPIFIAESPKVIKIALLMGLKPLSILCEKKHITGDAAEILEMCGDIPVYTGGREVLSSLTGYTLTRGVLCAMLRPKPKSISEICSDASRVCIIHGVCDTTNIGAIFRSASALGIDAVILSADSCDPLNRRAVRVSMGTVFTVPWTIVQNPIDELKNRGFKNIAMALKPDALTVSDPKLKQIQKLSIVLGSEGYGLPEQEIKKCDYTVIIPMSHGVDSLNVAAASAVAFWELRKKG
ncbi:MAG: RNA methyltransferase [Muribaculaceae bacterium]|nr:RNA methyltransferase [Muribaculaceae bacterium]